jgi:hypothetical protein
MPDDRHYGGYVVLTGCIAKDLLPHNTFVKRPGDELTRQQKIEMTRPYADVMARRIKGKPLLEEHMEDEEGPLGEILHSWVEDDDGWLVNIYVDTEKQKARDLIEAYIDGRMTQLSLGHDTNLMPAEVSAVEKGARHGTNILKMEVVSKEQLDQIKSQEYKPIVRITASADLPDTSFLSVKEPRICCSWDPKLDNMDSRDAISSQAHIALRKPDRPVEYETMINRDPTIDDILRKVQANADASQGIPQKMPQPPRMRQQQMGAAAAGGGFPNLTSEEQSFLLKFVQSKAEEEKAARQPQVDPRQAQFQSIMQKLQNGGVDGDPANTGNSHVIYDNPIDQGLPHLMNIVNKKSNVFNSDELKTSREIVQGVATQAVGFRDRLQKLEAENEKLKKELTGHNGDKISNRQQHADMIAQLLKATGGPSVDTKVVQDFKSELVSGNLDNAVRIINPEVIKCSARVQIAEQNIQHAMDVQTPEDVSQAYMDQLLTTLNPATSSNYQTSHSRTLASATGAAKRGMKRGNSQLDAAPLTSSSDQQAVLHSWSTSGMHPSLLDAFSKVDQGLYTSSNVPIPESNKQDRMGL